MDENYQELANAIILQAVKDYRKALHILKRHPNHEGANKDKSDIEKFFVSEWYGRLTKVDGKRLLLQIQQGV